MRGYSVSFLHLSGQWSCTLRKEGQSRFIRFPWMCLAVEFRDSFRSRSHEKVQMTHFRWSSWGWDVGGLGGLDEAGSVARGCGRNGHFADRAPGAHSATERGWAGWAWLEGRDSGLGNKNPLRLGIGKKCPPWPLSVWVRRNGLVWCLWLLTFTTITKIQPFHVIILRIVNTKEADKVASANATNNTKEHH